MLDELDKEYNSLKGTNYTISSTNFNKYIKYVVNLATKVLEFSLTNNDLEEIVKNEIVTRRQVTSIVAKVRLFLKKIKSIMSYISFV